MSFARCFTRAKKRSVLITSGLMRSVKQPPLSQAIRADRSGPYGNLEMEGLQPAGRSVILALEDSADRIGAAEMEEIDAADFLTVGTAHLENASAGIAGDDFAHRDRLDRPGQGVALQREANRIAYVVGARSSGAGGIYRDKPRHRGEKRKAGRRPHGCRT